MHAGEAALHRLVSGVQEGPAHRTDRSGATHGPTGTWAVGISIAAPINCRNESCRAVHQHLQIAHASIPLQVHRQAARSRLYLVLA